MVLKVDIQDRNNIPVEVGEHTLRFYLTDDKVYSYKERFNEVTKELEQVVNKYKESENDLGTNYEKYKEVLIESFEAFFEGQDAFNKVNEQVNSLYVTIEIFNDIVDGLSEEIEKRTKENKEKKVKEYLDKKKRK